MVSKVLAIRYTAYTVSSMRYMVYCFKDTGYLVSRVWGTLFQRY